MNYRQFQKYPSDLGACGLWHPNPFGAPKTQGEGPEGDRDLPHQGLRQTAGADPIQSTQMCWEHRAGPFGVSSPPQIHHKCTGLVEQRGRRARTGASVLTHRKLLHFQSLGSQRPSCGDANTLNLTQKKKPTKKQLNWAAGLTPKCHHCSSNQHSETETCASHDFRFWVTNTHLLKRFRKKEEKQNRTETKAEMDQGLSNLRDNLLTLRQKHRWY